MKRLFQIEAAIYSDVPRTPQQQRRLNLMWWREKFASRRAAKNSRNANVPNVLLAPDVRKSNPPEREPKGNPFCELRAIVRQLKTGVGISATLLVPARIFYNGKRIRRFEL